MRTQIDPGAYRVFHYAKEIQSPKSGEERLSEEPVAGSGGEKCLPK